MALIEEAQMNFSDGISEGRQFWRLSFDLETFIFLTTSVSDGSGGTWILVFHTYVWKC